MATKAKTGKHPGGRPSKYNVEITTKICELLSSGLSLNKIVRMEGMPPARTIWDWLDAHPEFSRNYVRARELQAEYYADEIVSIADDGYNDTYADDDGRVRTNHDVINRSRLRVDARKWVASKLLPKKYGDRVQQDVEHAGEVKFKWVDE